MNVELNALIRAGWWTALVWLIVLVIYYFAYLVISTTRPPWILATLGKDTTWSQYQQLCLVALVVMKVIFLVFLIVLVWLTLWRNMMKSK